MQHRSVHRRSILKGTGVLGAAGLAAPFLVKEAFASSGEMNILMWSDYLPDSFIKAFQEKTGIRVNFTGVGSNEEIIAKMKDTSGQGFDLVPPTNHRSLQWAPLGLLQPFDLNRVPLDNVNPAMARIGVDAWNFDDKGAHWLPYIWGTEGIGWRTDKWTPDETGPSYGDVWSDALAGKTMGRAHSMMLGAGLYLERIEEMETGSVWAAYDNGDTMQKVWGQITEWCIARKDRIKLIWNDAEAQKNGFLTGGIVAGQTWDGPPLSLKRAGEPVTYQAPVEGALAWIDGLSMPIGARNLDQVYEFIKFAYEPETAGRAIDDHGYNSPVLGADKFAGQVHNENFAEAYPGDSLDKLNPWPAEAPWYAEMRSGFVDRFLSA